jgi:hypothetical protein
LESLAAGDQWLATGKRRKCCKIQDHD